jgi:hypothetical protein
MLSMSSWREKKSLQWSFYTNDETLISSKLTAQYEYRSTLRLIWKVSSPPKFPRELQDAHDKRKLLTTKLLTRNEALMTGPRMSVQHTNTCMLLR